MPSTVVPPALGLGLGSLPGPLFTPRGGEHGLQQLERVHQSRILVGEAAGAGECGASDGRDAAGVDRDLVAGVEPFKRRVDVRGEAEHGTPVALDDGVAPDGLWLGGAVARAVLAIVERPAASAVSAGLGPAVVAGGGEVAAEARSDDKSFF